MPPRQPSMRLSFDSNSIITGRIRIKDRLIRDPAHDDSFVSRRGSKNSLQVGIKWPKFGGMRPIRVIPAIIFGFQHSHVCS
jgi:hypothetical protein